MTQDYELTGRQQLQEKLKHVVPRQLLPNGAYAPVPGIYDIGWKGWMDMPAADFAQEMREFDNSIIRENREWALRLAPMVHRGELTKEQLRKWEAHSFLANDTFGVDIARTMYDNLDNKEVRDIIIRHASEENGHAELKADFLVEGLGMTRLEVWSGKPLAPGTWNMAKSTETLAKLKKENPAIAYAIIPFIERSVPLSNQLFAEGLRKQYHFPERILSFYDLHTYVDIYHERLGLYIMAKYGTKPKTQELFREALEAQRMQFIQSSKDGYKALRMK